MRYHDVMNALPMLFGLLLAGCCGDQPDPEIEEGTPAMEDREFVGKDALVVSSALRFVDDANGARFHRLRACFDLDAAGDDWSRYPLRKIGNFIEQDWCRGDGSHRGCSGGFFRETRDVDWRSLHTLHYPASWPEVFGLGVGAGHLPAAGEWGVSFAYYSDGGGITGSSVHVEFHRMGETRVEDSIHLGTGYGYDVEEAHLSVVAPGSQDEVMMRLFASPESLRDEAVARYDALLAEVERAFAAGEVLKCEYGEYNNDGIPPECYPRALTPEEYEAGLTAARTELSGRRDTLVEHHAAFHGLLLEMFDPETCW
ncbi:MAG: hypothetical protein QGH45_05320 [Myxococcota bacterium]|nr:hypothetical protein [Myxococcota bacterium]